MRFPNAFGGVKKIWLAEILALIGSAALLIAGIMGATSLASSMGAAALAEADETAAAAALTGAGMGLIGTGLFGLAGGVLAILSFIFQLVGLNQAGKDEANFKKGFIFALVGLGVSIVAAFFTSNNVVNAIFSAAQSVCTILVFVYTIGGISALAQQMGNLEMVAKGAFILKAVCGILVLSIIATIVAKFAVTLAGILGIVAAVASIVAYILYLSYLTKAKVMLAA